jgi:hypothetical protein
MDMRTNEAWIADLRAGGNKQMQALRDLRALLTQQLSPVLFERSKADGANLENKIAPIIEKTISLVLEKLYLI